MSNRLAQETSPYLLQHQENPVDWFPWGEEALEKARREEKPIFLSIGYSACHWCHVMEHESFEDASIAATLNEHFVPIKVDREERPDLDQIYMTAVQLLTGRGGWPMSVFLTPDLKPFYGGTYWPPRAGRGMPGFDEVLEAVRAAWHDRREQALAGAEQLTEQLQRTAAPRLSPGELSPQLLHAAAAKLEQAFDFSNGGFGGAPKFPHPMDLGVLLRFWSREPREGVLQMVRLTLDRMAQGGIYDHLGGGFARYSVDARWLVPHFEKMLYDNALLAGAYLEGYQATGDQQYARVVRETLDYLLREMTDGAGGLYSTEDADSEGVEGKFYVWSPGEIERVLGAERAETFCYVYDVSAEGNFEGQSILNLPKTIAQCAQIRGRDEKELTAELAESRAALLEVRNRRVRPGRDDKVLVSWNGLAIDALARAAGTLEEPRYEEAARRAADFILGELRRPDGRLLHTWRGGQAKFDAYLDDYACLANGLVSLYEATFEERYLAEAVGLADQMLAHFRDEAGAGFFYTADDHETLIARTRDLQDSSVPSGSGMAATALLRLAKLTGNGTYDGAAEETLASAVALMQQSPTAAGQMLLALDFHVGPTRQIAIVGDPESADTCDVVNELRRRFLPRQVVALRPPGDAGESSGVTPSPLATLFAGRGATGDGPTAYVCEDFTCQAPLAGKRAILDAWQQLGQT